MLHSFFTQGDQEMDYALQLHVQWINYERVCKELKTLQTVAHTEGNYYLT